MNKFGSILIAATLAAGASVPAFAQDPAPEQNVVTVQVDRGTIMASDGGEFATTNTGARLETGQRFMVTEGSSVTMLYDNNCKRKYDTPGVYPVEAKCVPGAYLARGGVKNSTVGIVVALGAIAVPIIESLGDNKGPVDLIPPSPVSR